jgi:long-chain acyl-CoA synthetase
MGKTLSECFVEIVERRGKHVAFMVKREGSWQSFDFDWGMEQAAKTAFGLESLGFEKGSRVAILSENRPEWATTDFGAMAAGFVGVPLYTTLIGEQIAYILHDAGVRVAFVSSMAHLSTVLSIRDRVPSIEKIVVFYPEDLEETDLVISLDTLKSMGEGHSREDFIELSRHVSPEDLATIVYTSGTTGDPKGVALTHHNFMAEFDAILPTFEGTEGDSLLSFLPLSHILQRVVDSFALLYGFTIAYAESLESLGENLREIRPTHIVAVPRVYEKIHGRIHAGVQQGSAVKRALFNWALDVGRRFSEAEASGGPGPALSLQHRIASALVFKKIHAATGGNIQFYVSTGAPLAKGLAEFFDAIGIRIMEAWGMTELSGAVTGGTRGDLRYGSVGKAYPGCELKITDEGEIWVRGDVVMRGYWNKPETGSCSSRIASRSSSSPPAAKMSRRSRSRTPSRRTSSSLRRWSSATTATSSARSSCRRRKSSRPGPWKKGSGAIWRRCATIRKSSSTSALPSRPKWARSHATSRCGSSPWCQTSSARRLAS